MLSLEFWEEKEQHDMGTVDRNKWKAFVIALAGAGAVGGGYLVYKNIKEKRGNAYAEETPKLLTAPKKQQALPQKSSVSIKSAASIPALNFSAQKIADQIYKYGLQQNITGVISALQQIRTVAEYSQVSEEYKTITNRNTLVKQTLVTGLLDKVFAKNQSAKDRIKAEFLRMGLKSDAISGKWSLSGFRIHKDLITITATIVNDWMGNKIKVSAGTILGDEKDNSNGTTTFIGLDNKVYKVATKDVKYLSAQY